MILNLNNIAIWHFFILLKYDSQREIQVLCYPCLMNEDLPLVLFISVTADIPGCKIQSNLNPQKYEKGLTVTFMHKKEILDRKEIVKSLPPQSPLSGLCISQWWVKQHLDPSWKTKKTWLIPLLRFMSPSSIHPSICKLSLPVQKPLSAALGKPLEQGELLNRGK